MPMPTDEEIARFADAAGEALMEPKPEEQYSAEPAGDAIDPMDELVQWDALSDEALRITEETIVQGTATTMPRISLPQPTLTERVDDLEALILGLFQRVHELEEKQK